MARVALGLIGALRAEVRIVSYERVVGYILRASSRRKPGSLRPSGHRRCASLALPSASVSMTQISAVLRLVDLRVGERRRFCRHG